MMNCKINLPTLKNLKKSKKILFALAIFVFIGFLVFLPMNETLCKDNDFSQIYDSIENSLNDFDLSQLQEIADSQELFSFGNLGDYVKSIVSGNGVIDFDNIIDFLLTILSDIILQFLPMFSLMIGICVVCSLISNIKSKFQEKSVSNIINFVCFSAVGIIIISSYIQIIVNTENTLNSLNKTMNNIFPILLTCMVAIGGTTTVSTYQPILAVMTNIMSNLMSYIALPICIMCFIFSVIGNLSDSVKLNKYVDFFSSLFKWIIGLIFTLFFAVLSIQGINASSIDSLSIKATKFTISSYIPIVGGYLSQGLDILMLSSVLIKNSIGLIGILIIISLVIVPIITVAIFSLSLKLASAVLEPIGNTKVSTLLSSISKSISMLSSTLICVGFAYTLSLGLMMCTLNI